jgi:hypothetical protein
MEAFVKVSKSLAGGEGEKKFVLLVGKGESHKRNLA